MSATDQFPPAHLIEEDMSQGEQTDEQKQGASGADQSQDPADSNQRLALPAKPANEDHARQLDVASGGRVALDELGPMVVSTFRCRGADASVVSRFDTRRRIPSTDVLLCDLHPCPPHALTGQQRRHIIEDPQLEQYD